MERITIKALTEKGKKAIKITAIHNKKVSIAQRMMFNALYELKLAEDYSTYELIIKPSRMRNYPEPIIKEMKEAMIKNGAAETDFIIEVK